MLTMELEETFMNKSPKFHVHMLLEKLHKAGFKWLDDFVPFTVGQPPVDDGVDDEVVEG